MNCPICNDKRSKKIFDKFPGYVEGTFFDIFYCDRCDSQYAHANSPSSSLYERIYGKTAEGYDRYLEYSNKVGRKKNPLKYLGMQEMVYYPVYSFLKDKKNLNVLEVGCGYGYLTYSINKMGNRATGIDLSKKAISQATKKFGKHYKAANIAKYTPSEKYDVIIAIELIEHLSSPSEFISSCTKMLKRGGKIILTTPNKDAYKNQVWKTELPPVHLTWMGKKSISTIARQKNLKIEFTDYKYYISRRENVLLNNLLSLRNMPPSKMSRIKKEQSANRDRALKSRLSKLIVGIMKLGIIKYPCNIISKCIFKSEPNIGVILTND